MLRFFTFLLVLTLLAACGDTENTPTVTTENTPKKNTEKPASKQEAFDNLKGELATGGAAYEAAEKLPSVELKVLENLWLNADYVDYVYYELPISASLDNQNAIQSAVAHIAEQPAGKIPGCKAIGRVFYQIEGENVLQGDIFFSKGCTYFLWVDDQGTYYAGNLMMDSALKFFASNIKAATGGMRQ